MALQIDQQHGKPRAMKQGRAPQHGPPRTPQGMQQYRGRDDASGTDASNRSGWRQDADGANLEGLFFQKEL